MAPLWRVPFSPPQPRPKGGFRLDEGGYRESGLPRPAQVISLEDQDSRWAGLELQHEHTARHGDLRLIPSGQRQEVHVVPAPEPRADVGAGRALECSGTTRQGPPLARPRRAEIADEPPRVDAGQLNVLGASRPRFRARLQGVLRDLALKGTSAEIRGRNR